MNQTLKIIKKAVCCTIILNRPKVRNALNAQLITELTNALNIIAKDSTIRCVCLRGSNQYFCAGADITWMKQIAALSRKENINDAKRFANLLATLAQLNKPTIAIVEGGALGGAIGLLACCDVVISDQAATFAFPEGRVGLIPAVISPYIIQCMGMRQTKRYFLTSEPFTALQAKSFGLVHEVVAAANLEKTTKQVVESILQNSPQALTMMKTLFPAVTAATISATVKALANIRATKQAQQGLQAFLEKRKPIW